MTNERPSSSGAPTGGEPFGKFTRTDRLGAGGMGEVWKAWDNELSRWVALKFLKGGDDDEIARFQREARIAGKLSHPGIGAIFEVGEAQGRHYIAMQYVDGKTLRHFKGAPAEAARLIRDAALAVETAHRRDIVHRDLKPDNMMTDGTGRLFVMDFGLARPARGASQLSVSGSVIGTPSYMPPEQAAGQPVDARADVYSLGATLYELLTGVAPFRGESVLDTLMMVTENDAIPPRKLKPGVDRDLETIVMKCLEKEADRRYPTAAALAEDLTRWLEGEPITAHPPSTLYLLRKKIVKRKGLVIAGVIGIAAVVLVVGLLLPPLLREREAKARAERVFALWSRISVVLSQAEALARGGELKGAAEKCDEGVVACREGVGLAETHYFLGRLHRVVGRMKEAREEFDRALAIDPAFGEARFERGLMRVEEYRALLWRYFQMGWSAIPEREGTLTVVQRLERRYPDMRAARAAATEDLSVRIGKSAYFREVDALYGQAELEYLGGDSKKGVELLERVVEEDPLNVRAWCSLARSAHEADQLQKALDLASKAIDRHRGFGEAYFLRAHTYLEAYRGNDDAAHREKCLTWARRDADSAVLHGCELPELFAVRSQIRLEARDYDGAIADATEALRRHPGFVKAHLFRGEALLEKGDARAGIDEYDLGLALDPKSHETLWMRSKARRLLGRLEDALADGREAVRLRPEYYAAWLACGELERELKQYAAALDSFERAAKLAPQRAQPRAERAGVLQDLGRLEEAIAEAGRAVEAEGTSWRGWFQRGMAKGQAGKTDEAIRDLEKALQLEPKLSSAWAGLGNCRAGKADYDGALKAYGEALRILPRSFNTRLNRGTVHLLRKDWAAAVVDFDVALLLEPENVAALVRRGEARLQMGEKTGAAADLEKALRNAPADWGSRSAAEKMLGQARE